ncbi:hypothetical protein [Algibacter sp. Ld11]|uniref:hypothetical protein n=1 Tax=Algibacter sp. Ld11 TaxID=649150 RepID=UPI0038692598
MKKILLVLVLVMTVSATFGQNKWHVGQNDKFVAAATTEYNLDEDQQETLRESRMDMVKTYISSNKDFKDGKITKEEKNEITGNSSKAFNSTMVKLTGKSYKELKPFLDKMREALKK